MKILKQFILPPLTGLISAAAATGISLLIFIHGAIIVPGTPEIFPDSDAVFLSAMMTLSAFLLCTAMLLCARWLGDGEKSRLPIPLFLLGAALASGGSMLLAMALNGSEAASLVLICYMIICDLIVITAFLIVMLLVRWILKRLGNKGDFLTRLRWQLPLSFVWFAAVYSLLLAI